MGAIDAGLRDLEGVFAVAIVVDARGKREAVGALVVDCHARESVAERESLIVGQLAVNLDVLFSIAARGDDRLGNGSDLEIAVQGHRVDERVLSPLADLKIGEEGCLLADRSADLALQPEALPFWLDRRERVAS